MNYPGGNKKAYKIYKTYGNRGMDLESDIQLSNEYYLNNDIAIIYKKPTPITIAKVNYPSRLEAVITEGILKLHLLLIIMEFIRANILILKQKKLKIQLLFL